MQKMTRTTHPEENEGASAMTNALRNDPKALRAVLTARRKDIVNLMTAAEEKGDDEHLIGLSDALIEIDSAMERLYVLGEVSTAPQLEPEPQVTAGLGLDADLYGEEEAGEEDSETPAPGASLGNNSIGDSETQPEAKPKSKKGPGIGLGFKPRDEEPDDDATEENPVKMTNKIRKEMGDSAADFCDDYALAIYEKVDEFFDNLVEKALSLGEEDDSDGSNDLIEMLRDEVGKRGVARILPVFEEWRAGVIKQVMKDVNDRFAPPDPDPDPLAEDEMSDVLGLDEMEDDEIAEGMDDEPDPSEDEAEDEAEDAVEASAPRLSDVVVSNRARGPVSFKVKRAVSAAASAPTQPRATDFKPSGRSNTQLE